MLSFEAQALGGDAANGVMSLVGTCAYSTAQARTGVASIRCNPASGAVGNLSFGTTASSYAHFGMYVATLPSVDRVVFAQIASAQINVRLTPAGALAVYVNTTLIGTSAAAFATPGWHWIGIRQATGTSVAFLQIDGVNAVTGTATATGNASQWGAPGTEASAVDLYIDDVIVDDAGFLQPSKVDIALPISDNTVTNTTDANGATTNLWQAVDNTPPAGVAQANEAANPKSCIHFPASLAETYTANLETYTTLGVGAGDTVIACQSIVRHGEDVATGTKNGTFGVLTNPSVGGGGVPTTFGLDAGAHGAEPGLWATSLGAVLTSPSVTLGTSPTISVQRASEARVGCVDFMGMTVAWTPSVGGAAEDPYPITGGGYYGG